MEMVAVYNNQNYDLKFLNNCRRILLEDVGSKDGGQRSNVPALLLKWRHASQEAAQEAQQTVVQLGKVLKQILQISTQLFFIVVI